MEAFSSDKESWYLGGMRGKNRKGIKSPEYWVGGLGFTTYCPFGVRMNTIPFFECHGVISKTRVFNNCLQLQRQTWGSKEKHISESSLKIVKCQHKYSTPRQ